MSSDFPASVPEPPPQIIEGILHQGCKLILVGTSKSNKSWCLLDPAIAVTSGKKRLGRRCTFLGWGWCRGGGTMVCLLMKKVVGFLLLVLCLSLAYDAAIGEVGDRLLDQTWGSFQKLESARQEIDPETLDTNLVAVAVLHATNHARKQAGLAPLKFSAEATKAAAVQSRIMRERESVSHENPERPRLRTLEDRAEVAGIKDYRFIAENVATAFGLQYEAGKPFFTRLVDGREVYSYRPGGKPIPRHTYASFAEALVRAWMESPGHRQNILSETAEYLGASCLPEKNPGGMTKFYCTQVFMSRL